MFKKKILSIAVALMLIINTTVMPVAMAAITLDPIDTTAPILSFANVNQKAFMVYDWNIVEDQTFTFESLKALVTATDDQDVDIVTHMTMTVYEEDGVTPVDTQAVPGITQALAQAGTTYVVVFNVQDDLNNAAQPLTMIVRFIDTTAFAAAIAAAVAVPKVQGTLEGQYVDQGVINAFNAEIAQAQAELINAKIYTQAAIAALTEDMIAKTASFVGKAETAQTRAEIYVMLENKILQAQGLITEIGTNKGDFYMQYATAVVAALEAQITLAQAKYANRAATATADIKTAYNALDAKIIDCIPNLTSNIASLKTIAIDRYTGVTPTNPTSTNTVGKVTTLTYDLSAVPVQVPNSISKLTFWVQTTDPSARMDGNVITADGSNQKLVNGEQYGKYNVGLAVGTNVVTIKVTAVNLEDVYEYKFIVVRQGNNVAQISDLTLIGSYNYDATKKFTVLDNTVANALSNVKFSSAVYTYNVSVPHQVNQIDFTKLQARVTDVNTGLQEIFSDINTGSSTIAFNGEPAQPLTESTAIPVGTSVIKIVVDAENDSDSKTYTINLTRQADLTAPEVSFTANYAGQNVHVSYPVEIKVLDTLSNILMENILVSYDNGTTWLRNNGGTIQSSTNQVDWLLAAVNADTLNVLGGTYEAQIDNNGVVEYTQTVTISANQTIMIKATSENVGVDKTTTKTFVANDIDTLAPSVTLTEMPSNDPTMWFKEAQVYVEYNDNEGALNPQNAPSGVDVSSIRYVKVLDADYTTYLATGMTLADKLVLYNTVAQKLQLNDDNHYFTVTGNGAYVVFVPDNVGNYTIEVIKITNVDNQAPVIVSAELKSGAGLTVVANNGSLTNGTDKIYLNISATDVPSEIASIYYTLTPNTDAISTNPKAYSVEVGKLTQDKDIGAVNSLANGNYTLTVRVTDKAGNFTQTTYINFKINVQRDLIEL